MKREIRFRVWDTSLNRMLYNGGLTVSNNEITDLLGVPMQFTGLKDKNGRDVFEGDILHIEYFKLAAGEGLGVYEVEAQLTGVVEFDGLSLVLQNIVGEKWSEYTGYDAGEGKCRFVYLGDVYEGSLDASYQIEVIGNIYENPELLKP